MSDNRTFTDLVNEYGLEDKKKKKKPRTFTELVDQYEFEKPLTDNESSNRPSLSSDMGTTSQEETYAKTKISTIKGFEGLEYTDDVLVNMGLGAKRAVLDTLEFGKEVFGPKEQNTILPGPVSMPLTIPTILSQLPEALYDDYKRYIDAGKEGKLGEVLSAFPVQVAQSLLPLVQLGAGIPGSVLKTKAPKIARLLRSTAYVADVAEILTDPVMGAGVIWARSFINKKLGEAEKTKNGPKMVEDLSEPTSVNEFIAKTKAVENNIVDDTIKLNEGDSLKSASPDVEKNWWANKGLGTEAIYDKIKKGVNFVKESSRHFPKLDPIKDGAVTEILRQFENIPNYSKNAAFYIAGDITKTLGPQGLDVFTRNLVVEDMIKDIDKGIIKPIKLDADGNPYYTKMAFEYTLPTLKADAENFRRVAENNPKVTQALTRRKQFYNLLKRELVDHGILGDAILDDDAYFHHQVMDYMSVKAAGKKASPDTFRKDVRKHKKGFENSRIEDYNGNFNTDYLESEFEIVSHALSQLETMKSLKKIKEVADIKDQIKQSIPEGAKWEEHIPEGYTAWQPEEGNLFYKSYTMTEQNIDEVVAGLKEFDEIELKEVLAMGGKKAQWVIPENLAQTLNDMNPSLSGKSSVPGYLSAKLIKGWKQWTLFNPFRFTKYYTNNFSGDLDIAMAYDPKILKELPSAFKELTAMKKTGMNENLRMALRKGVIDSGFTVQELPDVKGNELLKHLQSGDPNVVKRYFGKVKDLNQFRENLLRYTTYKYFQKELGVFDENPNPNRRKIYAASKKSEIDAINGMDDRAAKLSRELIGDYGNISQSGQWMRKHMMPFYSWMEVNAPRYYRLLKNTALEVDGRNLNFKAGGRIAAASAWKATKAGGKAYTKFAVNATALYTAIELYNRARFPKEHEELKDSQRGQVHLITGRRDDGTIKSIRFQGALSDALNWFALEDFPSDAVDLIKGEATLAEKAGEAGIAPFKRVLLSSRPVSKSITEALSGKSLYPDPANPRSIRDKYQHLARAWSADKFHNWLTGKPVRNLSEEVASLLVYHTDPGENAYRQFMDKINDFLEDNNVERHSYSHTRKSNALYYYKQALKYKDTTAAKKWYKEYEKEGGTPGGIRSSYKASNPLKRVPKKLRGRFVKSLSEKDKKLMFRAMEWQRSIFTQNGR